VLIISLSGGSHRNLTLQGRWSSNALNAAQELQQVVSANQQ
jgi:hypothetical protein